MTNPPNSVEEQYNMLLSAKFSPPVMRSTLVARSHLLERLHNAVQHHPLTLISAPAGSGKSTLLANWYASFSNGEKQATITWVLLEISDNDPVRFWTVFITALQQAFPALGHNVLAAFSTPHTQSLESIIHVLLQDMMQVLQPYTLVLDDYHVIETPSIHQALTFLLEHLPPHIHVVVSTRTDPPFPLARLRVRGQLAEIRAADLSFTSEDAETFFTNVMALHLTPNDISTLVASTEGWIAGLQLAALSLQGRKDTQQFITTFTGSHSSLVDYLAEEILQRQPEYIQHFLLRTSLLEHFTAELCDAVLEKTGSHLLLKQIEQANLFVIALDEQRQWYRYHHLFAEFLRTQLYHVYPECVANIHRKAAYWYEQHGYKDEAITHLLAVRDFVLAAEFIERYSDMLMKRGEINTLLNLVASLPDTVVRTRPRLCLYYVAALVSTDQLEAAELRMQEAERVIEKMKLQKDILPLTIQDDLQRVMSELATIRTTLAGFRGDIPHTIALSKHALTQLPTEDVFMRGILTASLAVAYATRGDVAASYQAFVEAETLGRAANHTHLWLASLCSQAYMVMEQGHLYQAAEICRHVLQYATTENKQEQTTLSMAYMVMGELYYQWNMLDEAERFLQHGNELGQEWGFMNVLARGALFLARIKNARGDGAGARILLQRLEQQALQYNLPQIVTWAAAMQAYVALTQGDTEAAIHWAKGSGLSIHDTPDYLDEFVYLILTQIFVVTGKSQEVMPLLVSMLKRAEADGRGRNILDIIVTQALVYYKLGDIPQAHSVLTRAIALAEPEGNLRTFIEAGEQMMQLLASLLRKSEQHLSLPTSSQAYVQMLLTAMDHQYKEHLPTFSNVQQRVELLTGREHEILHLLASGLSNQQIADTLVIALNTVKWYLKQLSQKLNAHSRTQIVAHAHEQGLL